MDFFTLQDKARNQTKLLAFLFFVAVLAIVFLINLVFYFVFGYSSYEVEQGTEPLDYWLGQPYWIYITLTVLGVILLTSLIRSWQLKRSPDAIARMVNASPVSLTTKDPQQRQLINVVEEMSIASGTPMPRIFVMKQEPAINAFVAGLEPGAIMLVVTQGLLDGLNRQQLQGVVAHEYSHVFHGDMRINVKLIGILAGILVIGQIGHFILRSSGSSRHHRNNRSSNSSSSGNAGFLIAIGLSLFIIGYTGLFFGRLIKAAISRQREFLADASAVQYTRDTDGICGALYTISKHSGRSHLRSKKAEEMSHMCFGESLKQGFVRWLATHPPIDERINALDPGFDISKISPSRQQYSSVDANSQFTGDSALAAVGMMTPQHIDAAHDLLQSTPDQLSQIARGQSDVYNVPDFLLALMLANLSTSAQQAAGALHSFNAERLVALSKEISQLSFSQQHALFELALARAEQLSALSKKELVSQLHKLSSFDNQTTLSELMIFASVARRVRAESRSPKPVSRFKQIAPEIAYLFSVMHRFNEQDEQDTRQAFAREMRLMGLGEVELSNEKLDSQRLLTSLNQISRLHPMLKKDLLSLCLEVAESDGKLNQQEYEILRLLGEFLDCPFPIALNDLT